MVFERRTGLTRFLWGLLPSILALVRCLQLRDAGHQHLRSVVASVEAMQEALAGGTPRSHCTSLQNKWLWYRFVAQDKLWVWRAGRRTRRRCEYLWSRWGSPVAWKCQICSRGLRVRSLGDPETPTRTNTVLPVEQLTCFRNFLSMCFTELNVSKNRSTATQRNVGA
jgi:hypothetical protein